MKIKNLLLNISLVLMAACSERDCGPPGAMPAGDETGDVRCREFEWTSFDSDNERVRCKILWCQIGLGHSRAGGPATLWCKK